MIGTPRIPEFLRVELAYSTHAMHGGGGGVWHEPSHTESLESADRSRSLTLITEGKKVSLRIDDATPAELTQAMKFFKQWGEDSLDSLHMGIGVRRRFHLRLVIRSADARSRLRALFIEPLLGDESLKHEVREFDGHW